MAALTREIDVLGPWSLAVSRRFWEDFAPNRLVSQRGEALLAVFLADTDWTPVRVRLEQDGTTARLHLEGSEDLAAAAARAARFMAIDVDGSAWPDVAERDPVVADLQRDLPGFRPCGFYSPYEAAAWTVLAQRTRMSQATVLKQRPTRELGADGAFPAPSALLHRDLGLPGRKGEYLDAECEAALEGVFDGAELRAMDADAAMERVQRVVDGWRPFRTWAGVSLRALAPRGASPRADRRHEARDRSSTRRARSAVALGGGARRSRHGNPLRPPGRRSTLARLRKAQHSCAAGGSRDRARPDGMASRQQCS